MTSSSKKDPFGIFKLNTLEEQFRIRFDGLSPDMRDFIFEESCNHPKNAFFYSFYNVCADMITASKDLSEKQLRIVHREYKKEKTERMRLYAEKLQQHA